jgi:tetratricopeptide (TPR) repeat protein
MKPFSTRLFSSVATAVLLFASVAPAQEATATDPADTAVAQLQTQWAEIKYRMPDKKQQLGAITTLQSQADAAMAQYPNSAGVKIWDAIILSTAAGIDGGMSALSKVKQAKTILEGVEASEPTALNGSVYTSLGSLYYQVPGWPVGFGDDKLAAAYLQKALAVNPDGIDPNFFYGDYLAQKGKYKEAIPVLEKALTAAPRPNRETADAGRREEIQVVLEKARKKAGVKTSS